MRICRKAGCVWIKKVMALSPSLGPCDQIWFGKCLPPQLLQTSACMLGCFSHASLRSPMDCSLPGSSVSGIFQAGILKWIAISFSRGSSRPRDRTCVSCSAGGFFTAETPGKPHADQSQWWEPVSAYQWQPLGFCTRKLPNSSSPDTLLETQLLVNSGALIWTASGTGGHQNVWNLKYP